LQVTLFIIFLVLLTLLSAFFSMAETSFMSINRYRLRHKARMKKPYAIRLLLLLRRPDRLLGAILIGNTFANMLTSALATLLAVQYFGDKGAIISAVVVTFIVLIFAEIMPKTLAALYADKVARWLTYPIYFVMRLMHPLVVSANAISNTLLRMMRISIASHKIEPLSREEFRSIVYDTTGKISPQYQNMLLGILDLSHLTVDDVMLPGHEIAAIDIDQSWEQIKELMLQSARDAVPFYRGHVNHIIGVLYAHDMQRLLLEDISLDKEVLSRTLCEPYFVPESTPLNVQLDYFQQNQGKPAFVVDEYGEIQGMLTLDDILEEIVGDFTSSINNGKRAVMQDDGSYLVDGAHTVREFNRMSGWELPHRGPRTLNGLIVEYLESLPNAGTAVLIADYPIEIVQVKDKRVKMARIFPRLKERDAESC
jgi:Mg2+/Co2+ transporter CorB